MTFQISGTHLLVIGFTIVVTIIVMRWMADQPSNHSPNIDNHSSNQSRVNERYQSDSMFYQNDNKNYNLGNFFLPEDSPGYDQYNAYKKDPNVQPIQFPAVDYEHTFVSGLKKSNPIFAIPQKDVTFVNLLNP
jgi:hypothetical protein